MAKSRLPRYQFHFLVARPSLLSVSACTPIQTADQYEKAISDLSIKLHVKLLQSLPRTACLKLYTFHFFWLGSLSYTATLSHCQICCTENFFYKISIHFRKLQYSQNNNNNIYSENKQIIIAAVGKLIFSG